VDRGHNEVITIKFSAKHCQSCPSHAQCTRPQRRTITVRPHDHYRALQTARQRGPTEAFRQEYGRRAAVEGTISQGVRACGLRRSRQVGKAKTPLQYVATAAAINVLRIRSWRMDRPRQRTRTSVFAKLMVPKTAAEEKNRHLRQHPLLSPNLHCSLTRFFSFRELLFQ
jgi:transposase